MSYNCKVLSKGLLSIKFIASVITVVICMIFGLSSFIEEGMKYFFSHDYIHAFLQGYNGDRALLVMVAPLIATIPYATQHIENRKSGAMKYIMSRMGYKKYFNNVFIVNLLLSFLAFFVGMLLFFFDFGNSFQQRRRLKFI